LRGDVLDVNKSVPCMAAGGDITQGIIAWMV